MSLWVVPHILWCVHGTAISFSDIIRVLSRPLLSGVVAAVPPCLAQLSYGHWLSPLPRLVLGVSLFFAVYLGMLLYVMGEKELYMDIAQGLRRRPPVEVTPAVTESECNVGGAPTSDIRGMRS
jgi:PST family polysaccharide transporter